LEELDTAKSNMVHTMSHEMRTPLTSILGYLDLVLDEDPTLAPGTRTRLGVIERHARRLQDLSGDMLLLARLDSGTADPASLAFEIGPVLRRVEESLRPLADSRSVTLSVDIAAATIVEGDEGQLERALTNVVENAVKFTPASGVAHVRAERSLGPDGKPSATITVTDTGMGIPADEVPHVFDRFFRATNAQDQAVQGTGLGLAIVSEIVHAHHGEVSVSSVLGEGTTVRITLSSTPGYPGLDVSGKPTDRP
jgi:signal transduction histidine kinase